MCLFQISFFKDVFLIKNYCTDVDSNMHLNCSFIESGKNKKESVL